MRKLGILLSLSILSIPCLAWENNNAVPDPTIQMKPNIHGPGIGSDQYGRPVQLKPAYPNNGDYSNSQIQKSNEYGPGIHMDQYGRPVQITPKY